jgi:hypothetical protein
VAALLLAVFTFISGFSIGGAYLPAAGLLIVATGRAAVAGSGAARIISSRLIHRCSRQAAVGDQIK